MAGRKNKYESHIKPRFDEIKKWCKRGATDKEIIDMLGIGKSTFYKAMAEEPELSELIKKNRVNAVEEIKNALYKRAVGFQYQEKKTIEEQSDEGYKTRTEITTKTVVPDPASALILLKHWAKNEGWTNDPQQLDLRKKEYELKKEQAENENW